MSIDYIFYLSDDTPETMLCLHDFIEISRAGTIIRGTAFKEALDIVVAHVIPDESFIREELDFKPSTKLIATIDLDRYEESIQAIIKLTNCLVKSHPKARLYLNNESLLLSKNSNGITLHSGDASFWDEYLGLVGFPYLLN